MFEYSMVRYSHLCIQSARRGHPCTLDTFLVLKMGRILPGSAVYCKPPGQQKSTKIHYTPGI